MATDPHDRKLVTATCIVYTDPICLAGGAGRAAASPVQRPAPASPRPPGQAALVRRQPRDQPGPRGVCLPDP
jgi:hypothetical protein